MELRFQKLRPQAIIPQRATEHSAGVDLCACIEETVVIPPHGIVKIPTGLAVEPSEPQVVLMLCARSGLAAKHGIGMANGVGIVDADYRGEIAIPLLNQSAEPFTVTPGMRIAQLLVLPICYPRCREVQILTDTVRGTGGFGSTGVESKSL